jgi:hypothetical protein
MTGASLRTVTYWAAESARQDCKFPRGRWPSKPRPIEWIRKLGRTIDGDFFGWLQSKSVRCGAGKAMQSTGNRMSKAADNIVVIMARYQNGAGLYRAGNGIKALAKKYSVAPNTLTNMLREGGINTSARANYSASGKCLRSSDRERHKDKMKSPAFLVKKRTMNRIRQAIKNQSVNIRGSFGHVGCTAEYLRSHIESKFAEGMSWQNYGKWHIDHIKPCAAFDLSMESEVKKCFHWTNLQPLWAKENLQKGARYGAFTT